MRARVPEHGRRSAGFRNSTTKLEALLQRTIEVSGAAGINSREDDWHATGRRAICAAARTTVTPVRLPP